MTLIANLNPRQKEAVLHTEGPLLLLAGAGSGKTRVITYRIAYLIQEKNILPYNIMAVTFTNKAANEMRSRINDIVGSRGKDVFIRTFHSASVYILRRYGEVIGIPKTFSIYDQKDQAALIKEILIELRLDPKRIKPSMISSKISEIKDKTEFLEGANPESLLPKHFSFNFFEIFNLYTERLKNYGALDFNDLLLRTVELLKNHSEVLAELQRRWKYFMIDEYQDTNHSQYLICKYLSSNSRNICVVGDDDQSIYSWRGADVGNILNFENDYEDAGVIALEENYRSRAPILKVASNVIKRNSNRKEKKLTATRGDGESVIWCQVNNEYGEANYVVSQIVSLKNMERMRNSDFAILYRTNAQSRIYEDQLRRENITYKVIGGLKFYDRKEIKDIVSYLRFIANTDDIISLRRIINTPSRGIGNVTIDQIHSISLTENISEWGVLKGEFSFKGKSRDGIVKFRDIILEGIDQLRDIPEKKSLSAFVKNIVELSGYKKILDDENSIESRSRLENINEFINSVYDYELREPSANLMQFLMDVSLFTSEENFNENEDSKEDFVSLMTVHYAKGLEFPVVFLTGMEEGIFPHINSSDTLEGVEEERRLCYVGITRAKEMLFITNAEMRRSYGKVEFKNPSRFISEIPEELLEKTEVYEDDFLSSSSMRNHENIIPIFESRTSLNASNKNYNLEGSSKFKTKDMVIHPKLGSGKIVKISGKGDNVKLTIDFGRGGKKIFLEKYTPLERFR